ncbi:MAG: FeoB-associated Cys-rich membrane protein [Firmicutes bacterium]|nr:FeoB-associated Cys-rich membrane protein [Bacillota bacterium]
MADWIISILLACVVVLIIRKLVVDRRKGKSSCGCSCSNCAMCGCCHKK